jgi:hypothetical protein
MGTDDTLEQGQRAAMWTLRKMQIFCSIMAGWCMQYDISKHSLQSLMSDEYDKARTARNEAQSDVKP